MIIPFNETIPVNTIQRVNVNKRCSIPRSVLNEIKVLEKGTLKIYWKMEVGGEHNEVLGILRTICTFYLFKSGI